MKNIFYISFTIMLFAACSPKATDSSRLGVLKTEKDSLVNLQRNVAKRIKTIDKELLSLDTTVKHSTITTISIKPTTFKHYFKVYGVVESNKAITMYSESAGKIDAIKVERGQKVKKGQLLAVIDASVLVQSRAELETALDLAKDIYEKQKTLWIDEKIGSEVQYLEAKNKKESLVRKLATVNAQIEMTRVKAPFSGVIDEIFPKTGEMASPQTQMFRLVNLNEVYLTASISEAYVGKVKVGTPANVEFTSLGINLNSDVVRVGNFINPNNRTFDVNISLVKNVNFKPNMMASIDLEDYSVENTLVVPSRIVMENTQGKSYVYIFNKTSGDLGMVAKTMIEIGKSYNGQTEVLSGLSGNEIIVDKGSRSIKDGQKVKWITLD